MMGDLLVASPYMQISDSLKITFTASMQEFCVCIVRNGTEQLDTVT